MALTRLGPNQSINLTSNVTGTLATGNGGTGATSFAPGKLVQVKRANITYTGGSAQSTYAGLATNTITNPFCIKMNNSKKDNVICKKCYSFDMLETYRKNMQDCLQHNSELLSNSI